MDTTEQKRRRVLIVVSSWSPAMLADMQRARMLAWELPKLGWDVEVLTPRASEIRQDVIEPDPSSFFAADTPVHEVGSAVRGVFEALGSTTHAWRTWFTIRRRGRELLCAKCFDLVYFTTTTFVYFSLGPRWRRECDVPYVLDFHDPWIKPEVPPSRRKSWRSEMMARLAARMERDAVVGAHGIVSVSPAYIDQLRQRYAAAEPPWLAQARNAVIPFGALEGDNGAALGEQPRHRDEIVLRYVGAGGAIMARSFDLICRAIGSLRGQRSPLADRVRIELYGTTYGWRPGGRKELHEIARTAGVGDIVTEQPERVAYRQSLELLRESDGALILGVDDAGYMPSKLFSYALSGKPLLASLHRESPALALIEKMPGCAHALWFDSHNEMPIPDAARIVASFLDAAAAATTFDRRAMLEPFLAPNMARRHAELFDACVDA
jgi:hypothetical protein